MRGSIDCTCVVDLTTIVGRLILEEIILFVTTTIAPIHWSSNPIFPS